MFQLTRPRGARPTKTKIIFSAGKFQLTRPRGARRGFWRRRNWRERFQLTRPRGARPAMAAPHTDRPGFNSRAREGRDRISYIQVWTESFQLTRPRGARRDNGLVVRKFRSCFNSRAREGRDRTFQRLICSNLCFNSRAREGRDRPSEFFSGFRHVSTHAPARGATVLRMEFGALKVYVNLCAKLFPRKN